MMGKLTAASLALDLVLSLAMQTAFAQAPAIPRNVFFLATGFCPAGSKRLDSRVTFFTTFQAYLSAPLPREIVEVQQEGKYLVACQGAPPRDGRRYMSEIFPHAGATCPVGSNPTNGGLIAISQNQMLFSLLGTSYGGDGKTTYALPNLRMKPGTAFGLCIVVDGYYPPPS